MICTGTGRPSHATKPLIIKGRDKTTKHKSPPHALHTHTSHMRHPVTISPPSRFHPGLSRLQNRSRRVRKHYGIITKLQISHCGHGILQKKCTEDVELPRPRSKVRSILCWDNRPQVACIEVRILFIDELLGNSAKALSIRYK